MELDDVTAYARWLQGSGRGRPSYVTTHLVAKFLGVPVWQMKDVPIHYIDEAIVILTARHRAIIELAKKNKCSPEKIILPDF